MAEVPGFMSSCTFDSWRMRSVITHCCLFITACLLLFHISWRTADDHGNLPATPSPLSGIQNPNPLDIPKEQACLDSTSLTRLSRRSKKQFQAVPPLDLHLFSAFLDQRHVYPQVVIIGAAANFSETFDEVSQKVGRLRCLLVDGRRFWHRHAEISMESGFVGLTTRHAAIIIRCHTKRKPSLTAKIGLTFNYCEPPLFLLPIIHIPLSPMVPHGLQTCVNPLPRNYNRGIQMIEFVEHHRLVGVRHFTFYVHDVGTEANSVLQHYINEGIASLVSWKTYPFFRQANNSSEQQPTGKTVATQDCLYRRMNYKYPYILFLDVNEAIFPASKPYKHSLTNLMQDLLSENVHRTSLRVRHKNLSEQFGHRIKSQWIIRSDAILSMKTHWIGDYFRGVGYDVSSTKAVLLPLTELQRRVNRTRLMHLRNRVKQVKEILELL